MTTNSTVLAPPSEPGKKDTAHFATLRRRASTQEAMNLTGDLAASVESCEIATDRRKIARSATMRTELVTAIAGFVGNLLVAHADKKANGWVYRSMNSKKLGADVSRRTFESLVNVLPTLGYLTHAPGKMNWTANIWEPGAKPDANGGRAAHFQGTTKLLELAAAYGITPSNANTHFRSTVPDEPIILKSASRREGRAKVAGERLPIPETQQATEIRAHIKALNEFLDGFPLKGGAHEGYYRIFNEGDVQSPYQWNKGGRLYGLEGSYQNLKPEVRRAMTLGGSAVVEIDVTASYLTILHGIHQAPFDVELDPYHVEGISREAVKLWTVATLGHTRHHTKWPAKISKDYFKDHGIKLSDVVSAKTVRDGVVAKHPLLRDWGADTSAGLATNWADLMYLESTAMLGAMSELMRLGLPSLCVHDSLIVSVADVPNAMTALSRNYELVCGRAPHLKVSAPGPSSVT
jgi:hypothetical protein